MCTRILRITTVMFATLLLFFSATYAKAAEPETTKQAGQIEKKELRISNDGKTIVDQNGREVARFVKDIEMKQTEKTSQKLQGCMCCTPECLAYDQKGRCIKTYSSCTWDFDCNCN
ncbi:hypothetical protein [Syntrophorhabdus aromaticivorans]|uniref:hypothetical protein n=1 Tax=Syntrophorhabdus aromaticivorans TaxID=328301 RepID=UPI0004055BE4|nr:hypothetical protein [Syntrophorhabdus aromaticivorans]OPY76031.1 MAG: hypothetical protein A4E65_03305 [Syntrophorhabdus sp. PtaU1.Bin153]